MAASSTARWWIRFRRESKVIVHSESEVRGILVLLRSKNHPEGFRYELLVTSVTDHAKTL